MLTLTAHAAEAAIPAEAEVGIRDVVACVEGTKVLLYWLKSGRRFGGGRNALYPHGLFERGNRVSQPLLVESHP